MTTIYVHMITFKMYYYANGWSDICNIRLRANDPEMQTRIWQMFAILLHSTYAVGCDAGRMLALNPLTPACALLWPGTRRTVRAARTAGLQGRHRRARSGRPLRSARPEGRAGPGRPGRRAGSAGTAGSARRRSRRSARRPRTEGIPRTGRTEG